MQVSGFGPILVVSVGSEHACSSEALRYVGALAIKQGFSGWRCTLGLTPCTAYELAEFPFANLRCFDKLPQRLNRPLEDHPKYFVGLPALRICFRVSVVFAFGPEWRGTAQAEAVCGV